MREEYAMQWNVCRYIVIPLFLVLVGCGGSNETGPATESTQMETGGHNQPDSIDSSGGSGTGGGVQQPGQLPSGNQIVQRSKLSEASRFLGQATFGPTLEEINSLAESDFETWLTRQFTLPVTSMRQAFDEEQQRNPAQAPNRDWLFETFWRQAVNSEDQLRQRMAFALSQIFVISLRDGGVASSPRGAGDFYSRMALHSFGNFRTLLEQVALHPMMGLYLAHLGNEKGDATIGRVPDENFAREIMQLFTIGLYELNQDGSVKLNDQGSPIDTYATVDVQGLARVLTGFSWNGPDKSLGRYQGWIPAPDRDVQLMQAYPEHHSKLEKKFLDTLIPANEASDPESDLAIALDALFNHSNVGPFISKQLIQRLVSSNPSAQYISRVSSVFNDNGQGVRGDMQSVVRAILLDPEARDASLITKDTTGRIREPILRFAHWMRAFNAYSVTGRYKILGTDDPATNLGMTVLRSPSVFNFYRPGYVPPGTPIADAGLVSPEMQVTHETSVAGYLNSMLATVTIGGGFDFDIKSEFPVSSTLANDPAKLVDHVDLLLLHGTMSEGLKQKIIAAIEQVPADQTRMRAQIACYLAMASPEYIVQK